MADVAFDRLLSSTTFTREELLNIHQNFKTISSAITDDGLIDGNEFRTLMASHGDTIFIDALFRMFDRDNSGSVDFEEFVHTLAIYQNKSKHVDERHKLRLFFRVFDVDRDEEISENDLITVLNSCFRSNYMQVNEEDVRLLVKETMKRYSLTSKGGISFDSYATKAFQNANAFV